MLQKKLLPSFASFLLVLSACSTQMPISSVEMSGTADMSSVKSNSVQKTLIEKETVNDADKALLKMFENNAKNPNLNPMVDDSKGYKHLKVDLNSGFKTKAAGIISAEEHSVIVTVGTKRYSLSKGFMDKMRTLAKMYSPKQTAPASTAAALIDGTAANAGFADANFTATLTTPAEHLGTIFTTKAFEKLSAASGITVAAVTTGTPATGDKYAFKSGYTNSADETAFITLMKTYSSVEMPNYLRSIVIGSEASLYTGTSVDMPDPADTTLKIVVNTAGVSNAFFKRVESMLGATADSAQPDSGTDAFVLTSGEITTLNTVKYDSTTGADNLTTTGITPTTADKAFVTSITNKNPKASSVILLDASNNIVSKDINLYYEDGSVIGADVLEFMDDFTFTNRIGSSFSTSSYVPQTVYAIPATGSNFSATASLLAAKVYKGGGSYTAASLDPLSNVNGIVVDEAATFEEAHAVLNALHLEAVTYDPDGAGVLTSSNQGKFAGVTFATSAATTNASATTQELNNGSATLIGTNFDSLLTNLGAAAAMRINKTSATSLKYKGNIEAFFASTLNTVAGPTNKVVILPTTRTAAGAITLSSAAAAATTHYVALFAAVNPTGGYVYSIYDPGYNNDQAAAFYDIGTSSVPSTFLTSVFNFAGNGLLGVAF